MPDPETDGVAAAILAGGEARRLAGINKAALHVGATRIIDRQLRLLRQVASTIFIVSGDPGRFSGLAVPVVCDVLPGNGPLGGIFTALIHSPRPRTLVVACDMPFLTLPLLQRLAAPSAADVVMPRSERGYEPLCATWAAGCAGRIRRRLARGQRAAQLVVEDLQVEEIGLAVLASCDPHGRLFVNVNTPHEYERAQALSRLDDAPPCGTPPE